MEAIVVGGYCMWLVVIVWASLAAPLADTVVCTEVTSQSSSTSDSLSSS